MAVQPADIYIICVPTPFHDDIETPTPNIDYVRSAAESIAPHVKEGDIIILVHLPPVGTTKMVQKIIENKGIDTSKLYLAYCPERVLPGKIMSELVENSRVIGGIEPESTAKVAHFYKTCKWRNTRDPG